MEEKLMNTKRINLLTLVGELVAGGIGLAVFLLLLLVANLRLTDLLDVLELTPVLSETASFWPEK